jgi:hypothetical protein
VTNPCAKGSRPLVTDQCLKQNCWLLARQGELATTRRLGELHREAAEGRQKKVAELEGIVQEFRQHIKVRCQAGVACDLGMCPIRISHVYGSWSSEVVFEGGQSKVEDVPCKHPAAHQSGATGHFERPFLTPTCPRAKCCFDASRLHLCSCRKSMLPGRRP